MPSTNCRNQIQEAVGYLRAGGVVVFPTDTLYGLGADAFSTLALQRALAIKGRPAELALPVLVASLDQARQVVREFSEVGQRLAEQFWPGPLTLVFLRSPALPGLLTGGRDTVAVRMPDHWVPLALAEQLGRPITGTSANLSGDGDLLTLDEVEATLGRKVDYIIKCGPTPSGVASTIVNVTTETPQLVREGALPFDDVLVVSRQPKPQPASRSCPRMNLPGGPGVGG